MVRKSCAYKKVHQSEELAPEECDKKGIQTTFFDLDFGVLRRMGLRLNATGTLAKATACSIGLNAKDAQASIYSHLARRLVFFGGIRPSPVENGTEQESFARHYFAQASFTEGPRARPQRQAQKLS